MASRTFMALLAVQQVAASGPFKFCKENQCGDCPVQVTDAGLGYPNCVVYDTKDVFGNQEGFPGSDAGYEISHFVYRHH